MHSIYKQQQKTIRFTLDLSDKENHNLSYDLLFSPFRSFGSNCDEPKIEELFLLAYYIIAAALNLILTNYSKHHRTEFQSDYLANYLKMSCDTPQTSNLEQLTSNMECNNNRNRIYNLVWL